MGIWTLLKEMRIKDWYKNLIVFIPLFFSGQMLNPQADAIAIVAFVSLCLLSSSVYVFNDIVDLKEDKAHSSKKKRPLAAGLITVGQATIIASILLVLSLVLTFSIRMSILPLVLAFIASNTIYSLWARKVFVLDSIFIGVNFIIRAFIGAVAISVPISAWLFAIIFFLALYLTYAKRYGELKTMEGAQRASLNEYKEVVGSFLTISCAMLLFLYVMYTMSMKKVEYILSMPFATYALLRHMYLVFSEGIGENFGGMFLRIDFVLALALWAILILGAIYGIEFSVIKSVAKYVSFTP